MQYCKTLKFGSHFILALLAVKELKRQNKKTPIKIKEGKRSLTNKIKMLRPLTNFSQSDYLLQVVDINSLTEQ